MTDAGARRDLFEKQAIAEIDSLYGAAMRLTGNPSDAEDLVAEAVVKAWAAFGSLKKGMSFRPWLFRIMTNTFLSDYRKRAARPVARTCPDPDGDEDENFSLFEQLHQPFLLWWGNPEQEFVNKLLREDISKAIDCLPEVFRVVVILVDVEGFSYDETAESLEIPAGTVRSRLKRGRARLQKALWRYASEIGARREPNETVAKQ